MKDDPPALDDLGHPPLEIFEDDLVLVAAVDEEQLDRLVEVVRGFLRERRFNIYANPERISRA